MPKYPNISVQLSGEDGNAFAIMGAVAKALRRDGVPKEEIDAYRAESMSGDYDNLLRVAMAWVDVSLTQPESRRNNMGACDFMTRSKGKTAEAAFATAVANARHQHGHGGYTGTIAEKAGDGLVMVELPAGQDPLAFARELLHDGDPRIDDKWGPTGCIKIGEGSFLFFGYASS